MSKRRLCILGGCGGIGRSLAAAGPAAGYDVAVMDLEAALKRHPPPPGTLAIGIDGSDEASVVQAFEAVRKHWGALDGFVNAAGFMIARRPLSETPADEFDSTTKGNLRTTFLVCKAAMKLLEKGEAASLVNLASGLGAYIRPQFGPYAAAKAGIVGMTLPIARDLSVVGIRVNTIAPGLIDTPIYGEGDSAQQFKDRLAPNVLYPQRLGNPEEFASLALELVTNSYMNAETIRIDGGARLQPK